MLVNVFKAIVLVGIVELVPDFWEEVWPLRREDEVDEAVDDTVPNTSTVFCAVRRGRVTRLVSLLDSRDDGESVVFGPFDPCGELKNSSMWFSIPFGSASAVGGYAVGWSPFPIPSSGIGDVLP